MRNIIEAPETKFFLQTVHTRKHEDIGEYRPVMLRRTGPRGEIPGKEMSYPPRNRGLVIGIGCDDEIVVGYPYENVATQGYWTYPLFDLMDLLGDKLYTVLKGRIGTDTPYNGRANRILQVNKIPVTQLPKLSLSPREIGLYRPEVLLTPSRSERLLRGLNAQKLVIAEHDIATRLCGYLR